jgi:ubiquinone/menaquinone biosynthesis C-methylase UbiE
MTEQAGHSPYILGHSDQELDRLRRQAAVYADFTRSVLLGAGLGPGQRVLDVGCGVGDVSLAAAALVGPGGRVRGIDRSASALAVARARAAAEGVAVVFDEADIDAADPGRYDAVVGRFILLHRRDPVATLRDLAGRLAPGGRLAFVEMDLSTAAVEPAMPLFSQAMDWIRAVYRADGFETDMGSRLYGAFRAAGLEPGLVGTVLVEGGPSAYAPDYVAETVRSLLPRIVAVGAAEASEVDVDSLARRLREAALAGGHCFLYPRMIGAFARVP